MSKGHSKLVAGLAFVAISSVCAQAKTTVLDFGVNEGEYKADPLPSLKGLKSISAYVSYVDQPSGHLEGDDGLYDVTSTITGNTNVLGIDLPTSSVTTDNGLYTTNDQDINTAGITDVYYTFSAKQLAAVLASGYQEGDTGYAFFDFGTVVTAYDSSTNTFADFFADFEDTSALGFLTIVTDTPEPSSYALIALGVLGVASRRCGPRRLTD